MFSIYVDGELLYRPDGDIDCAATDPVLKLEMGKSGSLTFGLPVTNALYGRLQKLISIVQVFYDEQEIFEGRVLSLTRDFDNTLQVECEGELSYLVDSVQRNDAFTGKTTELLAEIISRHNEMVEPFKQFKMGKVTVEERDITITGQSDKTTDDKGNFDYRQIEINSTTNEWRDTLDYIETCLINYCGGYLRARRDAAGDLYLDWIADYYDQTTQTIEFGVNMLDLKEEDDVNDIFTILIPLGTNNLTIEEVNDGSPMLVDGERVAKYGRIIKTKTFDSVSKPETLKENGERYLRENGFPKVTLTINAVDLHQCDKNVEMIRLGDRVRVLSVPHSIGDYLVCTEIEYDLADPANTEYTFGQPTQSLTQRWRKDAQKSGGGGGGAAEAASEEAQRKIYDAWINVDADAGHVTLGALADKADRTEKTLTGMKEYLNMKVGIDVDAKDPEAGVNINIYTMRSVLDEHDKTLLEQGTYIKQINDDTKSAIEQTTAYVDQVNAAVANHYTEFIQKSSDMESKLTLKASSDEVHTVVTRVETAEKTLEEKADAKDLNFAVQKITVLDEEMDTKATKEEVVDLDAKVASLEISVSDNESKITAQADTITLKANKTYVDSQITEVKKLIADEIDARKADLDWVNSIRVNSATMSVAILEVRNSSSLGAASAKSMNVKTVLSANDISASTMSIAGQSVATKSWVNEQIAAITIPDISGDISVDSITAGSGSFSSLTLGENTLTRKSHTAITGIKGVALKVTKKTITYATVSGLAESVAVVTGVSIDQTGLTKSTINYYG